MVRREEGPVVRCGATRFATQISAKSIQRNRVSVAAVPMWCLFGRARVFVWSARQSDGNVSGLSDGAVLLSRTRISFPVLKKGQAFFATGTTAPVRGLRPSCGPLSLTEKAPKPRSSTRSPRRKASTILSNIALTTFSMSRSKRCGFCEEMRFMSSDFIMGQKLANWRVSATAARRALYGYCKWLAM